MLDVIPLHTGHFGINVIAENLAGISQPGRVNITVTHPAGYSEWLGTFFSPADLADQFISGPDADPDNDGFNNRLEYALAGNPVNASAAPAPSGAIMEIGDLTYATLRFTRRSQAPDLVFAVPVRRRAPDVGTPRSAIQQHEQWRRHSNGSLALRRSRPCPIPSFWPHPRLPGTAVKR